jgi:hypothetical protein
MSDTPLHITMHRAWRPGEDAGIRIENSGLHIWRDKRDALIPWDALQCRLRRGTILLTGAGQRVRLPLYSREALDLVHALAHRSDAVRAEVQRAWGLVIGVGDAKAPPGAFTFRAPALNRPLLLGSSMLLLAGFAIYYAAQTGAGLGQIAGTGGVATLIFGAVFLNGLMGALESVEVDEDRVRYRAPFKRRGRRLSDVAAVVVGREHIIVLCRSGQTQLHLPRRLTHEDGLLYLLHARTPPATEVLRWRWKYR